ncbi:MAG: DarT ssDNA thymidine ADP-ribosyltransferase family protein [Anaerolineae bacterium]
MAVVHEEEQIRQFLTEIRRKLGLARDERRSWPEFVYHYTDITNVRSILSAQRLLSRTRAEDSGCLEHSSGSTAELKVTGDQIRDSVRLYFRPKTPTQYHAEGVKSLTTLALAKYKDAHCPVPIFLLFDAARILSRPDCSFSDGTLNCLSPVLGHGIDDLRRLPWEKIYHIGPFSNDSSITHSRNAEVVVPGQLDLGFLRFIYCRTEAEKETLLFLLTPELRTQYRDKIFASQRTSPFYRKHTFVESARLNADSVVLRFSPDTSSPGPFQYTVYVRDDKSGARTKRTFCGNAVGTITIPLEYPLASYSVHVFLDTSLVYANENRPLEVLLRPR